MDSSTVAAPSLAQVLTGWDTALEGLASLRPRQVALVRALCQQAEGLGIPLTEREAILTARLMKAREDAASKSVRVPKNAFHSGRSPALPRNAHPVKDKKARWATGGMALGLVGVLAAISWTYLSLSHLQESLVLDPSVDLEAVKDAMKHTVNLGLLGGGCSVVWTAFWRGVLPDSRSRS